MHVAEVEPHQHLINYYHSFGVGFICKQKKKLFSCPTKPIYIYIYIYIYVSVLKEKHKWLQQLEGYLRKLVLDSGHKLEIQKYCFQCFSFNLKQEKNNTSNKRLCNYQNYMYVDIKDNNLYIPYYSNRNYAEYIYLTISFVYCVHQRWS